MATQLSSINPNKQKLCWISMCIPVIGLRGTFYCGTSHLDQSNKKFVIINNTNSMKSDSFVQPDSLEFYWKFFLR